MFLHFFKMFISLRVIGLRFDLFTDSLLFIFTVISCSCSIFISKKQVKISSKMGGGASLSTSKKDELHLRVCLFDFVLIVWRL